MRDPKIQAVMDKTDRLHIDKAALDEIITHIDRLTSLHAEACGIYQEKGVELVLRKVVTIAIVLKVEITIEPKKHLSSLSVYNHTTQHGHIIWMEDFNAYLEYIKHAI